MSVSEGGRERRKEGGREGEKERGRKGGKEGVCVCVHMTKNYAHVIVQKLCSITYVNNVGTTGAGCQSQVCML